MASEEKKKSFANFSNAAPEEVAPKQRVVQELPGVGLGGQREPSFILKGQGGLDGVHVLGKNSRPSVKTQRDASQRLQGPNPLPTEDRAVAPSPTTDFRLLPD